MVNVTWILICSALVFSILILIGIVGVGFIVFVFKKFRDHADRYHISKLKLEKANGQLQNKDPRRKQRGIFQKCANPYTRSRERITPQAAGNKTLRDSMVAHIHNGRPPA
jgi:hypothetical protein